MADNVAGFAPNWLFGQQNAGLAFYIATGTINGVQFDGQEIAVPGFATTYIWVTSAGIIQTGVSVPDGVYPIAEVISGWVATASPNTPLLTPVRYRNVDQGILSITDLRPREEFSFNG